MILLTHSFEIMSPKLSAYHFVPGYILSSHLKELSIRDFFFFSVFSLLRNLLYSLNTVGTCCTEIVGSSSFLKVTVFFD